MASTQPASEMPRLLATAHHNISALRRADEEGIADCIDTEIEGIVTRLSTAFPRDLNTTDQGQFALGYYHQRGYRKTKMTEPNIERK